MAYTYRLFGLRLDADEPWKQLSAPQDTSITAGALELTRGNHQAVPSLPLLHDAADLIGDGRLEIRGNRQALHFSHMHDTAYWCENRLEVSGEKRSLSHLLERAILPVIANTLRTNSVLVHGSMIENHDGAFVLFGRSGVGKSSHAWALQEFGWQLASDDIVLLDLVLASAFGAGPTAHLRGPTRPDEELHSDESVVSKFRVESHGRSQAELRGLVHLVRGDQTSFKRLDSATGLTELLRSSFDYKPGSVDFRKRRFETAANLVGQYGVHQLTVREQSNNMPGDLGEIRDLLNGV